MAQRLHSGALSPEQLDRGIIDRTYSELSAGVSEGTTGAIYRANPSLIRNIYANVYEFSSAKTYAELTLMSNALLDSNGRPRPASDFRKEVEKLNVTFNRTYLETERQTAIASARAAEKWEKIQARKHLFPNLRYRTAGDSHVRDAHAALEGFIAHVDDPIWDIIYPPNGFKCRCHTEQTDEAATAGDAPALPDKEFPQQFRFNVGKTGQVFSRKHPYFEATPQLKADTTFGKAMAQARDRSPSYVANPGEKNPVLANVFADRKDFNDNLSMAREMAGKLGMKDVGILRHGAGQGMKNPELTAEGIIGDRVSPTSDIRSKGISNAFRKKYSHGGQLEGQERSFIAFDLGNLPEGQMRQVSRRLYGRMLEEPRCEFVVIRWQGGIVKVKNGDGLNEQWIMDALKS